MLRIGKKILSILTPRQKRSLAILIFAMVVGGVVESISVSLIMPLVTAIMNEESWNTTWYAQLICNMTGIDNQRDYIVSLIILLIVIFLLKNSYLVWEYYAQYSFASKCKYRIQYNLLRNYMNMPYTFFLTVNTGEIVRIINGDTVQMCSALEGLLTFFTEAIVCMALGITIFAMSPGIALGIIGVLILEVLLVSKVIKPIMFRLGEKQRKESALAYQWLLQALNGIKSIKISRKEGFFLKKYSDYFGDANEIDRIYRTVQNMPKYLIEAFTICSVLGGMMLMVMNGIEIKTLVPVLSAFVLAAMRLLPSTNKLSGVVNQMPFLEGGLDNVVRILHSETHCALLTDEKEVVSKEVRSVAFEHEIFLEKLTFSYPDSEKKVLDEVSLKIFPKKSVGFIGASGGGKTTTVDLILGLLKPDSGKILVDGIDISENIDGWLRKVAYIPQQIFLIDASIKENIAFGKEKNDVDEEMLMETIKEAQLETLVNSLPDGVNTVIGEQGIRLSGGQRQRIGIARALYSNAEVLFFDEATSALDNETEQAVMDSINRLKSKKTMIIIAHRLSTIENCDVVYRVEEGKVSLVKNLSSGEEII